MCRAGPYKMNFIERADLCKKEIDSVRPFEGHMLEQVKKFYRISTTWSSNALEGNTLLETLEASGHARAYDYMFTLIKKNEITWNDILVLHQLFMT